MSTQRGRPGNGAASSRTGSSTEAIVGEVGEEWGAPVAEGPPRSAPYPEEVATAMVKGGVPVFCSRENESFDPAVTDRKDPRTKE